MLKPTITTTLHYYGGQSLIHALWDEEIIATSACGFDDPFEFCAATIDDDGTGKLGSSLQDVETVQEASDGVFYAICFSRKANDIRMWAQYGENHRGIMLTIDLLAHEALKCFFDERYFFDVDYIENNERCESPWSNSDKADFSLEKIKTLFTTKGMDWKDQMETRLLISDAVLRSGRGDFRPFQDRMRAFLKVPHQCITEVTLGYRSPRDLLATVEKIKDLKRATWAISTLKMHDSKFEFVKEYISQV